MTSLLKRAFVIYDNNFIEKEKANEYFESFQTFDWKYNDYNGYKLNRQTCAFADKEIVEDKKKIPAIWGNDITIKEWTPELLEIKQKTEQKIKELTGIDWKYNIALGNRYTKRNDFIAFHSDNEELGNTKSIASLSFGIPRTFHYMSKNINKDITEYIQEKESIILENGSLIFMGDNCQENYRHGMKKEDLTKLANEETLTKYDNTRINITFRVWDY